jgi:hypothetical protein
MYLQAFHSWENQYNPYNNKKVRFIITFNFHHRAVIKKDHCMDTFVELCNQPFCDSAVANSTVVCSSMFARERKKVKQKNKKIFETCSEEEAGLPGQYQGAAWPFHRFVMFCVNMSKHVILI